MVYKDAEKLYAEVREDTEALVEKALAVLYPGSFPLSAGPVSDSGPLTIFAHNTTPFARRDIVRVPLADGGISSGSVLQTSSDGKGSFVVLEGGAGGGLVLPTQISGKDIGGAQTVVQLSTHVADLYTGFCSLAVTVHSSGSDCFVLGNSFVQLTVAGGRITSLFDVRLKYVLFLSMPPSRTFVVLTRVYASLCVYDDGRRELIPQGQTGGLTIFEDHPNYWDAWGASHCAYVSYWGYWYS
jgi:alpha-mannosidase